MLVIHGIWAYGALQVWAEDSALPAQAPPRRGRPSRAPRPHPFAAAAGRAGRRPRGRAGRDRGGRPGRARRSTTRSRCGCRPRPTGRSPHRSCSSARRAEAATVGRRQRAAGRRWPPGGCPCSSSSPPPRRRCWRRWPNWHRGTSWSAARSATWPPSPGSPTTWRPAAGCCPRSPRRTAGTPPAGGRCCPPPTRGTPASSPRRCRPPAAPWPTPRPTPRPARCSRTCSTRWRTRRCAPGCPVPCCPRAGAAVPARIGLAERMLLALTAPHPLVEVADAADEREARDLAAAFADWLASAALPAGAVRTCFRLVEPPARRAAGGERHRRRAAAHEASAAPHGRRATPMPGGSSSRSSRPKTRA